MVTCSGLRRPLATLENSKKRAERSKCEISKMVGLYTHSYAPPPVALCAHTRHSATHVISIAWIIQRSSAK